MGVGESFSPVLDDELPSPGAPRRQLDRRALIPCFRDGTNGMCSYRIQDMMLQTERTNLDAFGNAKTS
ncbi:MAG: hypothetical protein KDK70_18260 [Myxococcales bacterium]|nr:hypothetical protein [Myxococcales bacterium]